jgi:hypothetical protein
MYQATLKSITLITYPRKDLHTVEILRLNTGEFRISLGSTLEVIGNNKHWIETLNYSQSKLKRLRHKGFSGEIITCQIQQQNLTSEIETISFNDCLTIWEYFANKCNRQATAILKACARKSLSTLVKEAFIN